MPPLLCKSVNFVQQLHWSVMWWLTLTGKLVLMLTTSFQWGLLVCRHSIRNTNWQVSMQVALWQSLSCFKWLKVRWVLYKAHRCVKPTQSHISDIHFFDRTCKYSCFVTTLYWEDRVLSVGSHVDMYLTCRALCCHMTKLWTTIHYTAVTNFLTLSVFT